MQLKLAELENDNCDERLMHPAVIRGLGTFEWVVSAWATMPRKYDIAEAETIGGGCSGSTQNIAYQSQTNVTSECIGWVINESC